MKFYTKKMKQDEFVFFRQNQIDMFYIVLRSKMFQICIDLYHLEFIQILIMYSRDLEFFLNT